MGWGCDSCKIVCSSEFSSKYTDFTTYNFQSEEAREESKNKDTLLSYEEVFYEVGNKLFKIKSKKNIKKTEVYSTVVEALNSWGETKNEDGIVPKWKGSQPYKKMEPTNAFFYRIRITNYDDIRESTVKKLNLERAPNWEEVGEGWWVPIYKYKGLIVPYEIKSVLLKVVTTDANGTVVQIMLKLHFLMYVEKRWLLLLKISFLVITIVNNSIIVKIFSV